MEEQQGDGGTSTARVEMFSDGVFAIAATLLILEIKHPTLDGLASQLWRNAPGYLAYVVSFLLIGMIWINHHRMFGMIVKADAMLMGLNLLLLMDVAFLPYPTGLLAEAFVEDKGTTAAAVFYGLTLVLGGIFYNAFWLYASWRGKHTDPEIPAGQLRRLQIAWGLGPVLYIVPTLVAFWFPWVSLWLYVALLVTYFVDLRPKVRTQS